VQQGERLERKTKQVAADTAAAARSAATARAKEMQDMAGGTWDKLEQVFEDRVARALGKLGVYTQNDVRKLADRVDALSAAVNELLKSTGAAPPAKVTRGAAKPRRKAAKAAPKAAPKRGAKRKPAA
jgi:poly(hydroxyalkanoate) granule-associated protein